MLNGASQAGSAGSRAGRTADSSNGICSYRIDDTISVSVGGWMIIGGIYHGAIGILAPVLRPADDSGVTVMPVLIVSWTGEAEVVFLIDGFAT